MHLYHIIIPLCMVLQCELCTHLDLNGGMYCFLCSDGTGRTGTYILIDMVLNRMAKGEDVCLAGPIYLYRLSQEVCRESIYSQQGLIQFKAFQFLSMQDVMLFSISSSNNSSLIEVHSRGSIDLLPFNKRVCFSVDLQG